MVTTANDALARCRARIAACWVSGWPPARLGGIELRDDQREAVARVARHLDRHRGCLLADDVGRGKTYVALASARRWIRPLVVVPASLGDTWRLAMARAGVGCALLTHEALSRGRVPDFEPDGIIVDESHRFRNPGTRRHATLARIASRAELLLISATPVQNSVADLAAQLSLFLGSVVGRLDVEQLASFVVRVETDDSDAGLPLLVPPTWVPLLVDDADVLEAILDLPPPPRALDAGDSGALRTSSLVRAWASSRAALLATIARRRRTALAIEQGLDAGRLPTRAELRSWQGEGEDAIQLGFATLLATHEMADAADAERASLRSAVDAEHAALARLSALLRERAGVDQARFEALSAIVRDHPGERVIAFTGFASTARAYHRFLRHLPGIALLTAAGATIASGRITRRELMARFAPAAHGLAEPPLRERITLLVSTDLLSEGVNLQDASVVVHLDLPWNPARLAQRVGRVRRPHGCATVRALLLAPPARSEQLLDVETRLRRKLANASHVIGRSLDVVPALTLAGVAPALAHAHGAATHRATLERRLRSWRGPPGSDQDAANPLVGAVRSPAPGCLALLDDGRLIASLDGCIGVDSSLLERAVAIAEGDARDVCDREVRTAQATLRAFLANEQLLADCGVREPIAPIARAVAHHASRRLAAVPRHRRPRALSALARLRDALSRPCPLGAERALASMLAEPLGADACDWLDRAVSTLPAARSSGNGEVDVGLMPRVLLLLGSG